MKTFRFAGLALVLFLFGLSCSESGREINAEQLQKRGDDLYYAVNEEKPYSGKVVELYESGQKRTERSFKNGKLHGLSTTWDSDGQKKSEVGYENGGQSGPYRTWYDNGQQEKEGAYKDGKESGKWVFWYDNGQKAREGTYKDGKREGSWNLWTMEGEKLETGKAKDIDGNTYLTIKIGEQWWMAENLKVARYRNGDAIPNVTDGNAWSDLTTDAYCSYDNDPANVEIYGYLYNWYAVNESRGLAPGGWHVASDAEWQKLVDHLGGGLVAGGKMKETIGWNSPNTGATNESGISVLPGGYRYDDGDFYRIGLIATFWSSTENHRHSAWLRYLHCYDAEVGRHYDDKQAGFSVRCLRD